MLLTGNEIDGGRILALSLGAAGFVVKPGGLGKLFEGIDSVLGGESGG